MSVNNTNRSILTNYLLGQGSSSTQGRNYVKNEFARDGVANVTASGTATVAKNTTTPLTSISDFLITLPSNATDYVEWTLDTLDNSLNGQNCQLTFDYKLGSIGSVVQAQTLIGGVLSNSQTLSSSPTQSFVSLNVPCGTLASATTVRISNATGNTGTSSINVANVNYGKATNIGSVTPSATLLGTVRVTGCAGTWSNTSSSFAVLSTQTSCSYAVTGSLLAPSTMIAGFRYPDLGPGSISVEYEGGLYDGAGTNVAHFQFYDGTTASLEDSSIYSASGLLITNSMKHTFNYTAGKSAGTMQIRAKNDSAADTGVYGTNVSPSVFRMYYTPTTSQQLVSSAQADYDWTAYTPTFTGFGTASSVECFHARVESDVKIRCKFTAGTTTATEARVSLPTGLTSADTTKIPSIEYIGASTIGYATASTLNVLIEPNVTYVTFGWQSAGTNGLTKQLANNYISTGQIQSFFASVPIQGWTANQRAPTLIGSVTSNSTSAERLERIGFSGGNFSTVCSTSPCTIASQSDSWISSVTRTGLGAYTLNVATAFSSPPTCTCRAAAPGTSNAICGMGASANTTTSIFISGGSVVSSLDIVAEVICMGPR